MVIYRAENTETGEVVKGDAKEVAQKLGITTSSLYNAVSLCVKVKKNWIVTHFSQVLLDEWDKVTEPFKRASRKAKTKAGGA